MHNKWINDDRVWKKTWRFFFKYIHQTLTGANKIIETQQGFKHIKNVSDVYEIFPITHLHPDFFINIALLGLFIEKSQFMDCFVSHLSLKDCSEQVCRQQCVKMSSVCKLRLSLQELFFKLHSCEPDSFLVLTDLKRSSVDW